MGQQQLILLVLAVVIVGVAIVVGIRAFSENATKSNADAMMQDAVRIANDMQAWKLKPAPFGGQAATTATAAQVADSSDFTGATFPILGYKAAGTPPKYINLNGEFTLTAGKPAKIQGTNTQFKNTIDVWVCGLNDRTMDGFISVLGGASSGVTVACAY